MRPSRQYWTNIALIRKKMFKKEKKVEAPKVSEASLEAKVEKKAEAKALNPSEVVVDGKLYKSVAYTENGCAKHKLVEVK